MTTTFNVRYYNHEKHNQVDWKLRNIFQIIFQQKRYIEMYLQV